MLEKIILDLMPRREPGPWCSALRLSLAAILSANSSVHIAALPRTSFRTSSSRLSTDHAGLISNRNI